MYRGMDRGVDRGVVYYRGMVDRFVVDNRGMVNRSGVVDRGMMNWGGVVDRGGCSLLKRVLVIIPWRWLPGCVDGSTARGGF